MVAITSLNTSSLTFIVPITYSLIDNATTMIPVIIDRAPTTTMHQR